MTPCNAQPGATAWPPPDPDLDNFDGCRATQAVHDPIVTMLPTNATYTWSVALPQLPHSGDNVYNNPHAHTVNTASETPRYIAKPSTVHALTFDEATRMLKPTTSVCGRRRSLPSAPRYPPRRPCPHDTNTPFRYMTIATQSPHDNDTVAPVTSRQDMCGTLAHAN
jgi:hypothetical protein